MKKISGEVGIKCHQSCLVALVFCTKLYIKLAVSLCSFSQFSFRTANALVLKIWHTSSQRSFLQYLVSDFWYLILFKSYSPFCTGKWANWHAGVVFQHNLYFKSEFKKSRAIFFSSQISLAEETKRMSLARPVFNLKAIEFGAFFAYFHLFRHLKVIQLFQKLCQNIIFFDKLSDKKKTVWRYSSSGFKIRF